MVLKTQWRTFVVLGLLTTAVQAGAISSQYTALTDKACKTVESDATGSGWYKGRCGGVAGYQLMLTEGDIRQSIDVVAPNGKNYPLDLINKVSSAFSIVGAKAEWRLEKQGNKIQPIALIVRYNAAEDPEKPEKNTSYLVVSKITPQAICITDIIKPQVDANTKARQLADTAASRPCK
jgi:hypothetical protein